MDMRDIVVRPRVEESCSRRPTPDAPPIQPAECNNKTIGDTIIA